MKNKGTETAAKSPERTIKMRGAQDIYCDTRRNRTDATKKNSQEKGQDSGDFLTALEKQKINSTKQEVERCWQEFQRVSRAGYPNAESEGETQLSSQTATKKEDEQTPTRPAAERGIPSDNNRNCSGQSQDSVEQSQRIENEVTGDRIQECSESAAHDDRLEQSQRRESNDTPEIIDSSDNNVDIEQPATEMPANSELTGPRRSQRELKQPTRLHYEELGKPVYACQRANQTLIATIMQGARPKSTVTKVAHRNIKTDSDGGHTTAWTIDANDVKFLLMIEEPSEEIYERWDVV